MAGIFFLGDSHYFHSNIVRGCSTWEDKTGCRDFDTLEEYNETLIEKINKVVSQDSILYHLGDVAFAGQDNIWKFRKRLNVRRLHLLLGNHDKFIRNNNIVLTDDGYVNLQSLFTSVSDIIDQKIGGVQMVLCHYPIFSHHREHKGALHLYAHTHKELNFKPNSKCVSMECHPNFQPFSLEEILRDVK